MPNQEQRSYTPERQPIPFEQIALDNQDIRLSSHPNSPDIIKQYTQLQDPLLSGLDIPSADLFLQLPYNDQLKLAERFMESNRKRKLRGLEKDAFYQRIASNETEMRVEQAASPLARPFKLYDRNMVGKEYRAIYDFDLPITTEESVTRIHYRSLQMLTGGSEISYFTLRKITPNGVDELDLLNPNQSVFVFEGNAGNSAQYYRQNVYLNQAPLSLRQLTIFKHEAHHLLNEGANDVHHFLGSAKMKLLLLFKDIPFTQQTQDELLDMLKKNYKEWYLALLEPFTIAEAVSMYQDEVTASAGASNEMADVLEFLGPEFQPLQKDVDLLLADSLSTYLLGFQYVIGKCLLPQRYLELTVQERQRIAEIKANLAKQSEKSKKSMINQSEY